MKMDEDDAYNANTKRNKKQKVKAAGEDGRH
jgi:hypothetical protein